MRTLIPLLALAGATCTSTESQSPSDPANAAASSTAMPDAGDTTTRPSGAVADVTAVEVSGAPGSYSFSVTLRSPDEGCSQYADWWEVLDENGALVYRRILGHSHVDEQPFTRSGGPVGIEANQTVLVRGHMNEAGYGGVVFRGTPEAGFEIATDVAASFGADVETTDPLPSSCAF